MAHEGPDLSAMIGLGAALEEMLRFQDAHSVYLQALALAPDNPAVLIHAGLCARDPGLAPEARERLERAVALDERSPPPAPMSPIPTGPARASS